MERFAFEFVLRAILIAAAAAVVLRVFRIHAAAAQHAVWTGVLIIMLALPLWLSWGPKVALPVLPARGGPVATVAAVPMHMPDVAPAAVPIKREVSEPSPAVAWNWSLAWFSIYLLGAGFMPLRLAIGTVRASRLDSASCAAPVTVA